MRPFTRREFLGAVGLGAGAAGLAGCARPGTLDKAAKTVAADATPAAGPGRTNKPNIVLFFVDDNVIETIQAGGPCPNIRGLGERARSSRSRRSAR